MRCVGLRKLDSRLGKVTSFRERLKVDISADFFNIFNHVNFADPCLGLPARNVWRGQLGVAFR